MTSLTSYVEVMSIAYSIHEARARFSEVLRQVRNGKTVTVSYRGEPVTEIRSIPQKAKLTLDERLRDLERRGSLVRSSMARRTVEPVERQPGALARFLAERDEWASHMSTPRC